MFSLTIADFFNAPSVDEVDLTSYNGQVGDLIVVLVHDDFAVCAVHMALNDAVGNSIESGEAVEEPAKSGRWVYTATTAVAAGTQMRILITAKDHPGSTGSSETEKTL